MLSFNSFWCLSVITHLTIHLVLLELYQLIILHIITKLSLFSFSFLSVQIFVFVHCNSKGVFFSWKLFCHVLMANSTDLSPLALLWIFRCAMHVFLSSSDLFQIHSIYCCSSDFALFSMVIVSIWVYGLHEYSVGISMLHLWRCPAAHTDSDLWEHLFFSVHGVQKQ
jgi:hypothetical protein